jgi:hypothetical protein
MLCIVAIIWSLNIWAGSFIDKSTDKLLEDIDATKDAAQSGDAGATDLQVEELRYEWESVESRWEILVDHREVDRIDTLMTHLEAMAEVNTLDTLVPELDELEFFLTHIDDKHQIRPENIL